MEAAIDADARLDYIEFQIFPSQNRFDASVCCVNKKEKVTSGLLDHLLLHSHEAKDLHSKGSNAKYRLTPPDNTHDFKWFTKTTLIRFLDIIGSSKILDIANSVKNEISQLEEARRFHISLYAKGTGYQIQGGKSDSSYLNGTASAPQAEVSDASKNELLRAIDLRLTALEGELTLAFDQAVGFSRLSVEEMTDLEKFSYHFGSTMLRDSLRKHIELIQRNPSLDISSSKESSESDRVRVKGTKQNTKSLSLGTPVVYGVSPAKVAQIERQSSTESDDSSFSSEEEQPSVERSRTLIRSASPRRSASPMRRIQIGRSGSRRSTAITVKSLNYIPARDKSFLLKDPSENDSDEEGSEQTPKKTENNAKRMSVQDKINLFENKQKDKTVDIQKAKSLLNATVGANKSVLRRWSSGIGEDSSHCSEDIISENAAPQVQNGLDGAANSSPEPEAEPCGLDVKSNSPEERAYSPVAVQEETLSAESTNVNEIVNASAEWSRQKEAELNELLMKMMENKPVKNPNVVPDSSKRQSLPAERRGGLYDNYKEKRDDKLRGETAKKKAEKDKQFKAMQQVLDARKSQLTSAKASDAGKKRNMKELQKSQKKVSQPAIPKTESPKPGGVKKPTTRSSSMPATRKSWPAMPSPRAAGASSPKTPAPITPTGTIPTRRRSQPAPVVSRPTPKVETSEPRKKAVKSNQVDSKKTIKSATEKKQQPTTKPSKPAKSKVQTASEESVSSAKPSLYSKVTRKGSVVPLESKPFLRKGSGTSSGGNPVVTIKASSHPQEPTKNFENLIPVVENARVSDSSDPVTQHEEIGAEELKTHPVLASETSSISPQKFEDVESFSPVKPTCTNVFDSVVEPEFKADIEEESTISPTAWVEIEEHEDQPLACETGSPAFVAPVRVSSPRVRHSLSQMLLEETSEPDIIDWGNAENPPTMVYQKDAPKGLKRLLKFARKSKTDTNSTGWSSPSVFSEGEDDSEDSKVVSKKNSENLLKKATLHSMNNGHQNISYETFQNTSTDYERPAQANFTKFSGQTLSQQLQEGHALASSVTSTKATRSFFSLSAFKGSK
ncbi:hypothetical protein ACJIZ3_022427 [Penstemon smallii]|uniref:COP1-interacting protein 7 n=1 Tax=Penstemon smallii TaxID=265156 RepID=A0ABD3TMJ8_9LAMI